MTDEPVWVARKVFTSHQVTIPAAMLNDLGIRPGDVVYVAAEAAEKRIVIVSKEAHDRRLR